MNFLKLHKIPLLLFLTACAFYWCFAYDLERTDVVKVLSLYGGLFLLSWKIFQIEKKNLYLLAGAALLFRLILLFSIPNLSQDFYRFIWDGKLLLQGLNPYIMSPDASMASGKVPFEGREILYQGMGSLSAGNITSYPPLNQLLFALAALPQSLLSSVLLLRSIVILADIGIFYFGSKLLQNLGLPRNRIFWYLLNPFIIIETTGNLHFEGVMIFLLLLGLYFLEKNRLLTSSIFFSLSVLVKLIPLIFLPLFLKKLGAKKGILYTVSVGMLVLLFFLPFFSESFTENYRRSLGLWFQKFEFNASFYYLISWIGFQVKGYNIIHLAGPLLGLTAFIGIVGLAVFRRINTERSLMTSMLFAFTIYLFLSTTVHPWYLATPLFLSIFTRCRFMLLWSLMVVLTYTAYANPNFQENLWLVALEYLVVFLYLVYELLRKKPASKHEDAQTSSA